jgi:hypothetical protein
VFNADLLSWGLKGRKPIQSWPSCDLKLIKNTRYYTTNRAALQAALALSGAYNDGPGKRDFARLFTLRKLWLTSTLAANGDKSMNPIDGLAWLHERFFANHALLGHFVFGLFGFVGLFLLSMWGADKYSKGKPQELPINQPNSSGDPDRHLSQTQKDQMLKALKDYKPSRIAIVTLKDRDERIAYAQEIEDVFHKAGWTPITRFDLDQFPYNRSGVLLIQHTQSNQPDLTPLEHVFEAAQIPHPRIDVGSPQSVMSIYTGSVDTGTPVIFVGPRVDLPKPP